MVLSVTLVASRSGHRHDRHLHVWGGGGRQTPRGVKHGCRPPSPPKIQSYWSYLKGASATNVLSAWTPNGQSFPGSDFLHERSSRVWRQLSSRRAQWSLGRFSPIKSKLHRRNYTTELPPRSHRRFLGLPGQFPASSIAPLLLPGTSSRCGIGAWTPYETVLRMIGREG